MKLDRLKKNLEKRKRPKTSSGEDENPVLMTRIGWETADTSMPAINRAGIKPALITSNAI
jgi:hypothetical protein